VALLVAQSLAPAPEREKLTRLPFAGRGRTIVD